MSNTQFVQADTLRSIAQASISSSYAAVGTAFTRPVRMLIITNNTDGDMFVSDDGTNNKYFLPRNSFLLLDLNANRLHADQMFVYPVGTQLWVKQSSAPTTGAVYVACIYGILNQVDV